MAMTPLPAAPQRDQDPATFAATADTFVAALPGFVTEANALQTDVTTKQATASTAATTATTQAGIATTQASNALASANAADISEANALASANAAALSESNADTSETNAAASAAEAATSETNAANYAAALRATSTTNITIGTGSKVFTIQTGKQFVASQYVQAISGSNWLFGTVTSYVTDQLTINVTATNGSGAFASWDIVLSGIQGIQGLQGIQGIPGVTTLAYSARTSNTQITTSDSATLIDITSGTFTQTFAAAATLSSGFYCYIRNSGAGDITLDPNGAETIDGLTSYIMYPGEVRLVQCDGIALRTVVVQPFSKTITSTANFTKPPGYQNFGGLAWSGGSGGRKSAASTPAIGGGGGGCFPFVLRSDDVPSSIMVTIGLGGTGPSTANTAGGAGGNTSFGSLFTILGASSTASGEGGSVSVEGSLLLSQATYGSGFDAVSPNSTSTTVTVYGGAAANSSTSGATHQGGKSVYGGASGGSITNASGAISPAGTSVFAGDGGGASVASSGSNGTAPAGGGGATNTGTKAGDGGRGELRIWGMI